MTENPVLTHLIACLDKLVVLQESQGSRAVEIITELSVGNDVSLLKENIEGQCTEHQLSLRQHLKYFDALLIVCKGLMLP